MVLENGRVPGHEVGPPRRVERNYIVQTHFRAPPAVEATRSGPALSSQDLLSFAIRWRSVPPHDNVPRDLWPCLGADAADAFKRGEIAPQPPRKKAPPRLKVKPQPGAPSKASKKVR